MALQKTITYKGLTVTDAYHKIVSVEHVNDYLDEEQNKKYSITLRVSSYVDDTKENRLLTEQYTYKDVIEADLTLAKHYIHLKSLDDFDGATDV